MFKDFFIRLQYDEFNQEYPLLLQEKLCPEIYLNNDHLMNLSSKDIENYHQKLKSLPANTIHAPFYDISPGGFNRDIRAISLDKLSKVLSIANTWQSQLVVVHFNYDPIYYKEFFNQWLDRAVDFFKQLVNGEGQSLIALENISEPTPYVALKLMEQINSHRIIPCFDVGHHHVFAKISFAEWLFYLKVKKNIHFHFHDNFGDHDSHLAMGAGNINWLEVKKEILNADLDFSVTLELHSRKDMLKSLKFYQKTFL